MIGQRGIPRRGANAAIALADQIRVAQILILAETPLDARPLVHEFGKAFRQAVRQRLGHQGVVVVIVLLEFRDQRLDLKARGDGERAEIIQAAALPRRDEIGHGVIGFLIGSGLLLPQACETS